MITDEQVRQAMKRNHSFFLSNREIEDLWEMSSKGKDIELIKLKNAYFSLFLEAMYLKAYKVDPNKAEKINDIKVYLLESIEVHKINNLQKNIINSLNLKLFEMELRNRALEHNP
jgi:hypothetical protein